MRRSASTIPSGPPCTAPPPGGRAEARLLAKRVEELAAEGGWEWRDIVLLLRATTSMGFYERALEERGIPTHVVGGRGYWAQQQVADLRHWLSALANPLDELAVYSVLASPLGGLSLDAVALIGLHAQADAAQRLVDDLRAQRACGRAARSGPAQARSASCGCSRPSAARAPQKPLETLMHRAVSETGYDRHILALPAGTRRMANVRKLMRMAREFEAEEGRDLRGFIDTLAERDAVQPREGEAPLEAEALDAVRLMTVHRAKGLEFPVVCVADLGKDGREDYGALRISEDGSLGLRLASIGGGTLDSAELERIKARQKVVGEEEEKRIFYVAVTRAMEHLVLSGATDLETLPEPEDMKEPMRWLLRGFDGPGVRRTELRPANVDELLPAADRIPVQATEQPPGGAAQPELALAALPAPRALAVSRLSYSSLESYRRCSYRFYLERALRLPRVDPPFSDDPLPDAGLGALLRGTLVHELLERLDFGRPLVPSEGEIGELIESHGAPVRAEEVADLREMVERFAASELCARRGAGPPCARRVAVRLHPDPAGSGRAQPAGQRGRGRPRGRGLGPARRGLQERCPRRARPGRADRRVLLDPAPRLRAGRAALRRRAGGGGALLPRAPGRPGGGRLRPRPTPRAWRRSCSSWPAGWWTGASSPPRNRTASSAATARGGPRSAPGRSTAHPFRQVPHLVCDQTVVRTPGERGLMPLCFIEPQEAIRVVAESVGREARRQLLGEVVRAWVDEIPDDELQVHYAKAVDELDDDDLSILAAWHASLEVGQPIANKDFLLGAFARLGKHRREALRIAAGFKGDDAFEAGVSEEQALSTVLPWLSDERLTQLAAEAVELYCWDRLGSDN